MVVNQAIQHRDLSKQRVGVTIYLILQVGVVVFLLTLLAARAMGHPTKAFKRHTAQPTEVPACTLLALAPPGVFIFAA
jgi:hypothetical protein